MTYIFDEKIRIGISACMYGVKVRYNSKGYKMMGLEKKTNCLCLAKTSSNK